jgi:hypothetical protein
MVKAVAAIVALLILPRVRDAQPAPRHSVLAETFARALLADTVRVVRMGVVDARDSAQVRRLLAGDKSVVHYNQALLAAGLVRRAKALLLQFGRLEGDGRVPPVCGACPGNLVANISFGTGPRHLEVGLWFREAQVRYMARDFHGWASIRDVGPELLALLRQALPADSLVQRYQWRPHPDSLPPP